MELQGKVAVVTGASSGIGWATARALAAAGMSVVAVARRGDALDELASTDGRIHPQVTDVTDDAAVAALAGAVAADHGACHVLVNNAGFTQGPTFRSPADMSDLRAVLDVNLLGAARCLAGLADLLTASAPARVINVASVAGKIGVGSPAYAASKFGLVGFTEALRPDWERRGVTISQLNPGFVRTDGFPQDQLMVSPLRRLVITPEQVATAVVEVARSGVRERTVPRWYRGLTVARHVAAPGFWAAARRMV
jgi:NAD(P)-dependent dehydrogenase (short-subunit alcohol dehydrogenase family)